MLESTRRRFAARAELAVEGDPGLTVSADRQRLEQALGNLVENALVHGPRR